ncbi:hypothetical protein BH10ACT7_BH10ACT7_18910 [soil metagenome]
MGFFDRLKDAISETMAVPDPNPVLAGTPARGIVTRLGNNSIGGEGAHEATWSGKDFWAHPVGRTDAETKLFAYLSPVAFRALREGVAVPLVLDEQGAALGLDSRAWEAEVSIRPLSRPAQPAAAAVSVGAAPPAEKSTAGDGVLVEGVDFATWASVEQSLRVDKVPPAQWDAWAASMGVPAGRWMAVQKGWQMKVFTNPALIQRFTTEYPGAQS